MTEYWIWLGLSSVLCAVYAIVHAKHRRLPPLFVWLFPFAALVFGYLCSKLTYILLQFSSAYGTSVFQALLLSTNPYEFSFFGAGLGVVLGAIFSAQLAHVPWGEALDTVALPCVLLAALARFSEFSTTLGYGSYMETLQFFPVSIQNQYGEWFGAVFMLEGVCALAVYFLVQKSRPRFPCDQAETAVFFLCLCQIFCESLRAVSIRWGFIRCEQVLCAFTVLALIGLEHVRLSRKRGSSNWLTSLFPAAVLSIGLLVAIEYALDKSQFSREFCYAMMLFVLALLAKIKHLYRQRSSRLYSANPPDML